MDRDRMHIAAAAYSAWRKALLSQLGELDPTYTSVQEQLPEWEANAPEIQTAWVQAVESTLRVWLETEAREALRCDEMITDAAAMLKVCKVAGDGPIDVVRKTIAAFLVAVLSPELLEVRPS